MTLLLAITLTNPAAGQGLVEVATPASSLAVGGSRLVWSDYLDCQPGEFPPTCRLRARAIDSDWGAYLNYDNTGGAAPDDLHSNGRPRQVAADASRAYFATHDGRILAVPLYTSLGTPLEIASKEDASAISEIAVGDSHVYWIENGADTHRLFRAPKAGGERELVFENEDFELRHLVLDDDGNPWFISSFNALVCCLDVIYRLTPDGAGGYTADYVEPADNSGAQSFHIGDDGYIYSAHDDPYDGTGNETVEIHRIPMSDISTHAVLASLSPTGDPMVSHIVKAGNALFFHEARSIIGPISRLPITGGTAIPITENVSSIRDMVVHDDALRGERVFVASGTVYELDTGADALVRNIRADEAPLEVIQTIQRPAQDVPLIEHRETFVRAYGRLATPATPGEEVVAYPGMVLHGRRDGAPLEDSPLRPIRAPRTFSEAPIDRTTWDNTWFFRLPESWTEGEITLWTESNGNGFLWESTYADNASAERTVRFNEVRGLCVQIMPVATQVGRSATPRFGDPDDWFRTHFARADTLLPVDRFAYTYQGGNAKRKPFGGGAYDFNDNYDTGVMLFDMAVEHLFSGHPTNCGGMRAVRGVAVTEASRFGKSYGAGPFIFWLMRNGGPPENAPDGGTKGLAHELGHQLGQSHVGCPTSGDGAPARPDGGYPYAPCALAESNDLIGYDKISQRLIVPFDGAGMPRFQDFMSYGGPLWASDYVYEGHLDELAPAPVRIAAPATGPALLVAGLIDEETFLDPAFEISDRGRVEFAIDELSEWAVQSELEIIARDVAGNELQRADAWIVPDVETEGPPSEIPPVPFFALLAPDPAIASLEAVDGTTSLAGLDGGAAAPTVSITSTDPVRDGQLRIRWQGRDADGDEVLYRVLYSPDDRTSWIGLGSTTERKLDVDLAEMPGGPRSYVKVSASDGVHGAEDEVGPFETPTRAPTVAILADDGADADGLVVPQSVALALSASAHDPEDGILDASALRWRFDGPELVEVDGGSPVELSGLAPGWYDVVVSAADRDGNVGDAAVFVQVAPKAVATSSPAPSADGACVDLAYEQDPDPFYLGDVATARLVRVDERVWLCAVGLPQRSADDPWVVQVDPIWDPAGGSSSEAFEVRVYPDGRIEGPVALGAARLDERTGRFSAEVALDVDLLGSWDRLIGVRLAADDVTWPAGAAPGTRGAVALGDASFETPVRPADPNDPDGRSGDDARGGCGCSAGAAGGPGLLVLLGLVLIARRRR